MYFSFDNNCVQLVFKSWKILSDRSPEDPHIHIKIPVCDKISHADDILPVNIPVEKTDLWGNIRGCISQHLYIPKDRILSFQIV